MTGALVVWLRRCAFRRAWCSPSPTVRVLRRRDAWRPSLDGMAAVAPSRPGLHSGSLPVSSRPSWLGLGAV
jgi:hypothetical protein